MLKRASTLMAITLISVCVWVAVVGLVIKPPFWTGAVLATTGGIAIGTVVAYLIWRWWFGLGRGGSEMVDEAKQLARDIRAVIEHIKTG